MDQPRQRYRFEDVTVDPTEYRVARGSEALVLTPRAFDLLVVLLRNAGRVVEKQDIFDAVWKDAFVTDNALVKIIKELRHVLGDEADHPHLIETVPKRGYRFIGNVSIDEPEHPVGFISEVDQSAVDAQVDRDSLKGNSTTSLGTRQIILVAAVLVVIAAVGGWLIYKRNTKSPLPNTRSIAVLPFKPLSGDSRDESLEMGMAETLISRLSNLRQLAVRPITAVRKFNDPSQDPVQAGQQMQVEAVLDGSIQKAGERIRVTVRLIDVRTSETIWNDKFDDSLTDIFNVQDSIADRVTNALLLQLSRQEREQLVRHETSDPEIYQQYLQCQLIFHGRRANWLTQSQDCYKAVVEKDSNFAIAYVGLAETYIMLAGIQKISRQEGRTFGRQYISRALEIDPNLAQAHNALAELKYQFDFDWAGADEEFKRALSLNPNVAWIHQANSWFLMCQGRFDEARVAIDTAKVLDPTAITVDIVRGRLYYYSRDYASARRTFEDLLKLEPNDSSIRLALHSVLVQQKDYDGAAHHLFIALPALGVPPQAVERAKAAFDKGGWPALLEAQLENFQENIRSGRPPPAWLVGNHYLRMGRKDEAFEWLEKSINEDDANVQMKVDPLYDILRDDPRYAQLLARIGLTP